MIQTVRSRSYLTSFGRWMRHAFIASSCSFCGTRLTDSTSLCASCHQLLIKRDHIDAQGRLTRLCASCGVIDQPLEQSPEKAASTVCSETRPGLPADALSSCQRCGNKNGYGLSCIVAPYRYQFPLDHAIKAMKYGGRRAFARPFGQLLAAAVRDSRSDGSWPDFIVPMPIHDRRLLERGYNQAADIGRWCARELQVPIFSSLVRRVEDTESLAGLTLAERQFRILGVFAIVDERAVYGRRIAIVDDVLTTGASAGELSRALYDHGAASVELWALARTSVERTWD